ncbi:MAG: hypothetical protein P4L44_04240 [Oryzomonas sp.]|uniref:hypothetical protein n=1 Tax=Oryzomonas sp. TaxID=2855186 RepID=UPI0028441BDA|nr:hypothetical protein [Oryzomonas sp.]MDR3579158.1 hypothetical protein [Oryzomonas sp.]
MFSNSCTLGSKDEEPKKTPSEILLKDPLSELTRKERRMLIVVSSIAITMIKTGLVPSKISALGVEFTTANQSSILNMIAYIIVYLLVAFAIYAFSDFVEWRVNFYKSIISSNEQELMATFAYNVEKSDVGELKKIIQNLKNKSILWNSTSKPVSIVRILLDIVFPILLGFVSIALIYTTDISAKPKGVDTQSLINKAPVQSDKANPQKVHGTRN